MRSVGRYPPDPNRPHRAGPRSLLLVRERFGRDPGFESTCKFSVVAAVPLLLLLLLLLILLLLLFLLLVLLVRVLVLLLFVVLLVLLLQ